MDDSSRSQLLNRARSFNEANDITGILLHDGYLFMQLLEGNAETVQSLYKRIQEDPRHTNVNILYCGEISKRVFSNWGMIYDFVEDGFIHESLGQLVTVIPRRPKVPAVNYGARLQAIILRNYTKFMRRSNLNLAPSFKKPKEN